MIQRVTQLHTQGPNRRDGHTDDGLPGDCWRAALAALLNREPATVAAEPVNRDFLAPLLRAAVKTEQRRVASR